MESLEGALKGSFTRPDVVCKPAAAQQVVVDDYWTVGNNGQTDDFFVDDLLDFSKLPVEEEDEFTQQTSVFLCPQPEENEKNCSQSVPGSDLCLPADDLADLEWLSNFVDDSASGYSLTVPAGNLSGQPAGNHSDPGFHGSEKLSLRTTFQTKARSKRTRTGVRVWSLGSHSLPDSATSSSSSSSYTSLSNPFVVYNDLGQSADSRFGKFPAKKLRKKPEMAAQPRRCSHCLVQKTPQWRTGPLGAKTLCNACGVRYKSGRLCPEYRPACSPTFSSEIHSNNHRKVLEMRRKKEGEDGFPVPA